MGESARVSVPGAITVCEEPHADDGGVEMLYGLALRISATIYGTLQRYAPTNILVRRLRARDMLRWAAPIGLTGAAVFLVVFALSAQTVADGGPGWLNLVVLWSFWNLTIPVSLGRLVAARIRERRAVSRFLRDERDAAAVAGQTLVPVTRRERRELVGIVRRAANG